MSRLQWSADDNQCLWQNCFKKKCFLPFKNLPTLLVSLTCECLCLRKVSLLANLPDLTSSSCFCFFLMSCHCLSHHHCSVQGFSVEGQENIQEILSKRLYLCQFLCALMNLRTGLYHKINIISFFHNVSEITYFSHE